MSKMKMRILADLEKTKDSSILWESIWRMIKLHEFGNLFQLHVDGSKILSQSGVLDLDKKSRILEIFRVFLESDRKEFNREELIRLIYFPSHLKEVSDQNRFSMEHNIVKLISRARAIASSHFSAHTPYPVHWFPFDQSSRTWSLYKIQTKELALAS